MVERFGSVVTLAFIECAKTVQVATVTPIIINDVILLMRKKKKRTSKKLY